MAIFCGQFYIIFGIQLVHRILRPMEKRWAQSDQHSVHGAWKHRAQSMGKPCTEITGAFTECLQLKTFLRYRWRRFWVLLKTFLGTIEDAFGYYWRRACLPNVFLTPSWWLQTSFSFRWWILDRPPDQCQWSEYKATEARISATNEVWFQWGPYQKSF